MRVCGERQAGMGAEECEQRRITMEPAGMRFPDPGCSDALLEDLDGGVGVRGRTWLVMRTLWRQECGNKR